MDAMTNDAGTRSAGLWFAVLSAASFGLSGALASGLMDAGWSAGGAVVECFDDHAVDADIGQQADKGEEAEGNPEFSLLQHWQAPNASARR